MFSPIPITPTSFGFTIGFLAVCFIESGCSSESGKAAGSKATRWNIPQIESKIKGWAKLKAIQLTEKENGKYEGTGTGEDGLAYKIKATYTYRIVGTRLSTNFTLMPKAPKESFGAALKSLMALMVAWKQ
jgi:hypothetical protein